MPKNTCPRCFSQTCKGRPMDDQEIRVLYFITYSNGDERARVRCDWCGHEWESSARVDRLPGYKTAEHRRASLR